MSTAVTLVIPPITLLRHDTRPCCLCRWWADEGGFADYCSRLAMPARAARAARHECGSLGAGWQPRVARRVGA